MASQKRARRGVARALVCTAAFASTLAAQSPRGTPPATAGSQLREACGTERSAAIALTNGDTTKFPYLSSGKSEEIAQLSAETSLQLKTMWRSTQTGDYSNYVICLFEARVKQISGLLPSKVDTPPSAPTTTPDPPLLRRKGGDGTDLLDGRVSGRTAPAPSVTASSSSNTSAILGAIVGAMAQSSGTGSSTSGGNGGNGGNGGSGGPSGGGGSGGSGGPSTGPDRTRGMGIDAVKCLEPWTEGGQLHMKNICPQRIAYMVRHADGATGGSNLGGGESTYWQKDIGLNYGACNGVNTIEVAKGTPSFVYYCYQK